MRARSRVYGGDGIDALLTPTTLTAAIPLEKIDQSSTRAHCTRLGNYLGLCALALPNGFTPEGLPTSLRILCDPGKEATALRIGWSLEQAFGLHVRHPPEP
jgi:aspartyl-tRNA(Asn)/glutamyl-tRNA(Gln) amidotransferase subunit A